MIKFRSASNFIIATKSLLMKYYLLRETIENRDGEICYPLCEKMEVMTATRYFCNT